MSWYPHAKKLLQKLAISNKAINMHYRGPTEQHFYVWEPHLGCLNKAKKCPGTPSLKRANGAIKLENVLVPHAIKLLQKCVISNKAINMHYRRPTEKHFTFGSLIVGAVYRPKMCNFQRSNKYAFWKANVAIKMKNVLVPMLSNCSKNV